MTYLRQMRYRRASSWAAIEGMAKGGGAGLLLGPGVLEEAVLSGRGRAWGGWETRNGDRGAYLGQAFGLRELGSHVSLVHANQGSVQLLSSLQVIF